MVLNAEKCQSYSFYCFSVIKGKSTEGSKNTLSRLGLKRLQRFFLVLCVHCGPSFTGCLLSLSIANIVLTYRNVFFLGRILPNIFKNQVILKKILRMIVNKFC